MNKDRQILLLLVISFNGFITKVSLTRCTARSNTTSVLFSALNFIILLTYIIIIVLLLDKKIFSHRPKSIE